jgi:selenocysteine lyase/cysteine desulfurase
VTSLTVEPAALAAVVGAGIRVPLVQGGTARYVNLDYAASAPALTAVAAQVSELLPLYASVHRGAGYPSRACTAAYESARREVAAFTSARPDDLVIITRNTTDALNLLAACVPGPVVHLDIEHHANLLPWQARDSRVVPAQPTLAETIAAVEASLARWPTALLSITGASNVTGECLPLAELAALAHRYGARIAVDGAQLVPHRRVDIAATGIDYLAFSGHKMYAPFGAGALIGRRDWLDGAPPYLAGGGAVRRVTIGATSWTDGTARHEAGTPNVVGAVALAAACRFFGSLDGTLDGTAVLDHEAALLAQLDQGLAEVGAQTHRIWPEGTDRVPVVTFTVAGYPPALVAAYLSAEHGIGVRDGKFCAHPLLARLGAPDGAVRASLGLGSQPADVHRLISALRQLRDAGPAWTYGEDWQPSPDTRPLPAWAGGHSCRLWPLRRPPAPRSFPGNAHRRSFLVRGPAADGQRRGLLRPGWLSPDRLGPGWLGPVLIRPARFRPVLVVLAGEQPGRGAGVRGPLLGHCSTAVPPRGADQRQRDDITQHRDAGQQRHRERGGTLAAVLDEDLPRGERAADGAQPGGRQGDQSRLFQPDRPGQQHDRDAEQRKAEQRVHGERERAGHDLLEHAGVLVRGRDGDVQVEENAQRILRDEHGEHRQAGPAYLLGARRPGVPARNRRFGATVCHTTPHSPAWLRSRPSLYS